MVVAVHRNADPSELDKFSRLADLWWDENGKMGMLHTINPVRMSFICDHICVTRKAVLDVGCGGGILSESLARLGASVTGIDLSSMSVDIARKHASTLGLPVNYQVNDVETLATRMPGSFDVITCMEMLEHVPDPSSVIASCALLLKPGGKVFFSTINRSLKSFLFAIVGGEYVLRLLPRGTHSYGMLIKPDELRAWCAAHGLHHIDTQSFMYNPFKRSFRLRKGADVNYISCFQKRDW